MGGAQVVSLVHEAHYTASLGGRVRNRRGSLPPSRRAPSHGSNATLSIPAARGFPMRRSTSDSSLHESPSQAAGGGRRLQLRPDIGKRWLKRLFRMSVFEGASMCDCQRLLVSIRELLATQLSVVLS